MTQINNTPSPRPDFDREAHNRQVSAEVAAEVAKMPPLSLPYRGASLLGQEPIAPAPTASPAYFVPYAPEPKPTTPTT